MAKISIIIPVHNAERSITKTLESVIAAAKMVGDAEIVCVDDGSTDNSPSILDEQRAKVLSSTSTLNFNFIVIHQENAGAYAARNAGASASGGEWLAFVDADDLVESDIYVKLLAFAKANNLQVAECDIVGYDKVGRQNDLWLGRDEVRNNLVIPWLIEGNEASFMWDKIYRRDVWRNVTHPSYIFMYDDLMTNLQVFRSVERFGILHERMYHYQINAGSSIRHFGKRNIRDFREIVTFRKTACEWYGIKSNDSRMKQWYRKNLINNIKLAIKAWFL